MLVCIFLTGNVLAAGGYWNYDLSVPAYGIGWATTNNQMKVEPLDQAIVCSRLITGTETLRASIRHSDGSQAAAYQSITSGQRRAYTLIPSTQGAYYHARIASYLSVLDWTRAQGKWSPDNPGICGDI
jgi:hypothetical protein